MVDGYRHGVYADVQTDVQKTAVTCEAAPVYVGTAPTHLTESGMGRVNEPILVSTMQEAQKVLGYSEDWAKYTLCEAMHAHFVLGGVGPIVLINVLDQAANLNDAETTEQKTPLNGRVLIPNAENIALSTVAVTGKTAGSDYVLGYDTQAKRIVLTERSPGSLGSAALTVSWKTVKAAEVAKEDIIGASDGAGTNTGIYAIKNVYPTLGLIPSVLCVPGYSELPEVRNAMRAVSEKLGGHWNFFIYTDLPLMDGEDALGIAEMAQWKQSHGYTADNEKAHYPLYKGTDGRIYHLSVLEAVIKQQLEAGTDGIPYQSASNVALPIGGSLYFGESVKAVIDDEVVNHRLCQNGITSAIFHGGKWVLWGAHAASYTQENQTKYNVADTCLAMLYYVGNHFQVRRAVDVDKPVSKNRMQQIVAEENARLDALVSVGALLYGHCALDEAVTDGVIGDYNFDFEVTTTPLAKSLRARIVYSTTGEINYLGEAK